MKVQNLSNNHKTKVLLKSNGNPTQVDIALPKISISPVARNLGVLTNQHLDRKAHVSRLVCQLSFMHLQTIRSIHKMLTQKGTTDTDPCLHHQPIRFTIICMTCLSQPPTNFSLIKHNQQGSHSTSKTWTCHPCIAPTSLAPGGFSRSVSKSSPPPAKPYID